eukprot:TRINITY_DN781_c0_g1_i10.p1 TRINITY_DN781_c0_g1~~TRINITY_DN781_c0_g1_i10.p1  ORF type:complete len:2527 (-),score=625.44 TRINITY_DN781_c0_g1_i10:128-7708(-)
MKNGNLCFAALCLFVLFVHVSESEAAIGGWNYESPNPMEMNGHKIVSRGSIVYSFGDDDNEEFVSQTSLFERIWMFDTKSMSWSWRMSSGDIPQRRAFYCAAIRGSKIHIFGGRITDGAAKTNDLYTFDCDSFVWKKESIHSKEIPTKRELMSCDTFENRLYMYGGFDGFGRTDFWYFDFDAQTWNIVKPQSSRHFPDVYYTQISTYKDAIMIFSGANEDYKIIPRIWTFNITRNEWMPPFEIPKTIKGRFAGTTSIFRDKLYYFGGSTDGNFRQQTNTVIEYNILTDQIQIIFNDTSSTTFPIAFPNRRVTTSSTFVDSKLVIVSGAPFLEYSYNDVWIFDVLTNKWTSSSLSLYPLGRYYASITIVSENEIGMFGGYIGWESSALINDLWIFNTELKQWKVLSRESNCRAVNPNCAPTIDRPAFGFYNRTFYVIGSDTRNKYFRSFSMDSMQWTSLDNQLASSKASGLAYSLNTVIDSRIFIWGGYSSTASNQDMIIFDMKSESEKTFKVSDSKIDSRDADMASTFVMDGRFCVMDTNLSKKRSIICWQESNNRWDVIGEVSSSVANYPIVIGHDVSLFTFGGLSDDDSNPSELGVYDVSNKNWTIITEQERNMPGRYRASAVINNKGVAYIVAGLGIAFSNTIYSLKLNELWCRGTQKVTASVKVVSDGSGLYRYHPGTQCRWELANVTHVVIEDVALAAGASLTIRTVDQCDKNLVFNAESSSQIEMNRLAIGDAIYVPNRQSLLELVVDSDGEAGEGFSVLVFECNAGFSARKDGGCYCGSGRFINFGGACVPCAEGSEQPAENQRFCIPKQEQQNQRVPQSKGIESIKPSESAEIGSLPPTVVYGHAAVIGSRIFVVGGSESVDASKSEAYVSMSRVHWTSQSVDSSWMESDVAGDIPSGRIDGCFVGVGTRGILIGGRSKDGDAFVYVFDANEMKWQRRKSTAERIGSVCGSDGADVYVFGGMDKQGKIINRLSVYKPDSDSWADLMSLDGNGGGVAYGGGGVVGRHFFIFGGFDGTKESDLLRIIDLDSKTVEIRNITLDECVKCADEGGICEFGRQRFMSFADQDGMMHVYGGVRQGEVLADMIVVELESGIVVHRENYGLSNPSLPLRHPGPKQGAAFASVGSHLVIVGGSGSNGLSANDVWTWDAGMRLWIDSSVARIPIHRTEASVCGLDEMGFVVFGGATHYIEELLLNDLWEFSLETNEWKLLFSGSSVAGPGGRAGAAMGVLSGSVFVAGGRTSLGVVDDGLWIFSMETKEWQRQVLESTLSMYQRPLQRQGAGFVWKEGRFVLWGGQIGAGTGRAEFYSAATLIDTQANHMNASRIQGAIPNRRKHHSMCSMSGNRILIHGGVDFSGNALSDSWMFDAESQSWQQLVYKHSGSFDVMKSSVCGSVGNSSVVFGTESQSGSPTAWMMQHDFGVQGKLLMSNEIDGSRGLEFQSGLVVSGVSVSFGGRNGNSMSNRVVVYRPGFCVSGNGVSISSGFQSAQFEDGSGDAMYLTNTNCVWRLENATNIVVEKRMRPVDSLRIMSLDGQNELTVIEQSQMQDGSERLVYSGSGFVVMMEASESEKETGQPCEGCFGFTITHAACDSNSVFDSLQSQCKCKDGFTLLQDGCVEAPSFDPAISQEASSDSVVGLATGLSVSGFVVAVALVGVFVYRRRVRSDIEQVHKKLFGLINPNELQYHTLIGKGASGEVYEGEWRGTEVAIKRLIQMNITPETLESFKQEISVIVELRHPNIVLFMGACLEKGSLCLVSELMLHGTLFDVLHDRGKDISVQLRTHFMYDIVKGMNYLHSSNPPILHRDLKSLNVLVDDRFRLKVSDFGLSTLQGASKKSETITGSLQWLAPEVLVGQDYVAASDVYSFGIIAWEIMTRCEPYNDIEELESIPILVGRQMCRPSSTTKIPAPFDAIIESSWNQKLEARPTFSDLTKTFMGITESSVTTSLSFLTDNFEQSERPPSGNAFVVCTRVYDAETLWEEIPLAMGDATMILVEVMKKICRNHQGYISQNDGESFVIVFQRSVQAIRFCLESQFELQETKWSTTLLEHDSAKPLYEESLKGLRVQMAIHSGILETKSIPDSDRVRFVGKDVSLAMKLCRAAQGGQILMSDAAYQSTEDDTSSVTEAVLIRALENRNTNVHSRATIFEVVGFQLQFRADRMKEAARHRPSIVVSQDASTPLSANLHVPTTESSKKALSNPNDSKDALTPPGMNDRNRVDGGDGALDSQSLRKALSWEIVDSEIQEAEQALGTGSFGSVVVGLYKAQKVAIKRMLTSTAPNTPLMFMMEVAVVRQLSHPNIVKFIGACVNPSKLAIVLELVEPGSLRDYLRDKSKPFTHQNKWHVIRGIIEGMAYLHSRVPLLLHRDLKSANILINSNFDAKICDFGFARIKSTTRTMTKCGTLAYQAPEILNGKRYNEKADVYSFGIVVWEIESRESPYCGEDPLLLPFSVTEGHRPSTDGLKDADAVRLMAKCWDDNPTDRPSFASLQAKRGEVNVIDHLQSGDDLEAITITHVSSLPE